MAGRTRPGRETPATGPWPGGRFLCLDPNFLEDLRWWAQTSGRTAERVLRLVEATMRDPFNGMGQPELLRHLDPDTWSRRITEEHRLVYRVLHDRVDFLQARYHY